MSGNGSKKKKSKKVERPTEDRGQVTPDEAAEIVEQSEEISTEGVDDKGGDTGSEEVPSPEVADARREAVAEQSPSTVAPTVENANMGGEHGTDLTDGQLQNIEEDDERATGEIRQSAEEAMPFATPAERASSLPIDQEMTDDATLDEVADHVNIPRGHIMSYAIRGTEMTGHYLTVVTADGKKHTVLLTDED